MKLSKVVHGNSVDDIQAKIYYHNLMGYVSDGNVMVLMEDMVVNRPRRVDFYQTMSISKSKAIKAIKNMENLDSNQIDKFDFKLCTMLTDNSDNERLWLFRKEFNITKPLLVLKDELVFSFDIIELDTTPSYRLEHLVNDLNNIPSDIFREIDTLMSSQDNPYLAQFFHYDKKDDFNREVLTLNFKQNLNLKDNYRKDILDSVRLNIKFINLKLIKIL